MPNVLNEFVGDGVTRTFNFSMTGGYLSRDFVVFLTRPNEGLLDYTPYTGTVVWVSDFTVEISEPIPVGTTFVITRNTTPEAMIDFQTTSRLTERNLDTAFNQSLHRTVEIDDLTARHTVVQRNLTLDAVAAAEAAEAAAEAAASEAEAAAAGAAAAAASAAAAEAEAAESAAEAAAAVVAAAAAEAAALEAVNIANSVPEILDQAIADLGFYPPVDYTSGLNVVSRNFTVTYNGVVYAAKPSSVPFTTGAWDTAQWYPIQNVLNQKNLLVFPSYAAASAAAAALPDGQVVETVNKKGQKARYVVSNAALGSEELIGLAKDTSLFKRSKWIELSFRDSHYDYLKPLYNYGDLYPQSFCVDTEEREIFILKSAAVGDNKLAWIWVHDMDTGAVKTVFTTGEGWRESLVYRKIGNDRYLYTISSTSSSVIRIKINTFPDLYASAVIDQRYAITNPALTFLAWDGMQWWVHSSRPELGASRRNMFHLYNDSFTELLTKVELPREAFGDFDATVFNEMVKSQGITAHKGYIYSVVGGVYVHNMSSNKARPIYRQGLYKLTPYGTVADYAVCDPDGHITAMSQLTGYTNTLAEPEGCYSDGENLYALWITLDPWIREGDEWLGKGIVLCLEDSPSDNAVDFSKHAAIQRRPFSVAEFQSRNHHDSYARLKNPVTGEELNSFAKIISMMVATGMSEYKFSGTGQTISDFNGESVAVGGRQITFSNVNGTTFIINITGSGLTSCQYVISGALTTPIQNGPIWTGAEFGSNANGEYIKYANGHLECWFYSSSGMVCDITAGALFRNNPSHSTWTYPHAFATDSVPIISGNPCNGGRLWGGTTGTPSSTSASPVFFAHNNDPTSRPYQLHATGRWK